MQNVVHRPRTPMPTESQQVRNTLATWRDERPSVSKAHHGMLNDDTLKGKRILFHEHVLE